MSAIYTHSQSESASPAQSPRLFPVEVDLLLQNLLNQKWQRLSSEYHDPLGMLFGNRARQWTAGWDADHENLYLLVWETDSWQEKPVWSLYQNGTLIFQEIEGFSKSRTQQFHQLLEGEHLPFIDHARFLEPLIDFRFEAQQRAQAGISLIQTILSRPEVFEHLKEPIFQALESDFDKPEWPLLDILKLHRVAHKHIFVELFRQCVQNGLLRAEKDRLRLDQALNHLQNEFKLLSTQLSFLFQSSFQQAQAALRNSLTQGNWRVRLKPTPLSTV